MINDRITDIHIPLKKLLALRYQAGSIQLQRCKKSKTSLTGNQVSIHRGRGMDFAEVRSYQAGDDIRTMDWRVTARTGKPHTKLYTEEKERPVYFVVDFNATMHFGTRVTFKSTIAAQITAILAWAAVQQGDRVAGLIFSQGQHEELKPRAGNRGVLPLLKTVVDYSAMAKQDLNEISNHDLTWALARLRLLVKPGSLIFIISDFHNLHQDTKRHLTSLTRHNDVITFFIYDALETQAPVPNQYHISNGQECYRFNSGDKNFRQQYQQQFNEKLSQLKKLSTQTQTVLYALSTEAHVAKTLQSIFK